MEETGELKKWMGLTDQQFDVFSVIMRLETKHEPVNIKNITDRYKLRFPKGIQRSNLYAILKILRDSTLVLRRNDGTYSIDYNGIQTKLGALKNTREAECKEITRLYTHSKEYLRSKITDQPETSVRYCDNQKVNEILVNSLATATAYYTTDRFPNIALSRAWAVENWKQRYIDVIYDRCVIKKELEIYFLSDLNIERYYNIMSEFYKSEEFVFKECLGMIDKLDNLLENNENIHVAISGGVFVIDVHLPEREEPTEYLSHMHDLQSKTMGGIYIKSCEAAGYIKQYFLKKFEASEKMEGKTRKRMITQLKCRLRERHKDGDKNKNSIKP